MKTYRLSVLHLSAWLLPQRRAGPATSNNSAHESVLVCILCAAPAVGRNDAIMIPFSHTEIFPSWIYFKSRGEKDIQAKKKKKFKSHDNLKPLNPIQCESMPLCNSWRESVNLQTLSARSLQTGRLTAFEMSGKSCKDKGDPAAWGGSWLKECLEIWLKLKVTNKCSKNSKKNTWANFYVTICIFLLMTL